MFNYNDITEYQIEITSLCNAACPQCPRNYNGKGINEHMPLTHLSRESIDQAFNEIEMSLLNLLIQGFEEVSRRLQRNHSVLDS